MGQSILAVDCGTQSVRALVFDAAGSLTARARVPITPYVSPRPGWAEQDPEYYWEALCRACRQIWQETGVARTDIAGVALTTQRGTIINVDRDGRPLRPAIVWLDGRRARDVPAVRGRWALLFRLAGLTGTIAYLQAEAEANWIVRHQPEVWAQTHKFLLLSGYLTYLLTGRFVDSVGCQVGYIPFDYKRLRWADPSSWQWQALPIQPDQLPDLVPPTAQLGEITPAAAEATGIPAGLPVLAAAGDKACEVLGSGCIETSQGALSYGTTATVNATSRTYVEPVRFIPPYPAAVPGAYSVEVEIYRGYWMVQWFKEEFGHLEQRRAMEQGVAAEALFDDLIAGVPPGSAGLLLQPYWSPGLRHPGPEARGAVVGFTGEHTRAHLYRAILEGIAFALRDGRERVERRTHAPITSLTVAGGGSQSDAAMQITADIFGLPAARPSVYEASGLGAAVDAAVGLGLHPDIESAVRDMTRTGRIFEPDPHAHSLYDALYRRVYRRLYGRLKDLYEAIGEITARRPE